MAQSLLPTDLLGRNIDQLGNYTLVSLTATGVTPLLSAGDYKRLASNRLYICAIGLDGWTVAGSTPTLSFGSGASANDWSSAAVVTGPASLPSSVATMLVWTAATTVYASSILLFQVNVTGASLGKCNVALYGAAF